MAVNKVMLGSETLLDLTGDTVTRATLLAGHTAHNAAGEQIEGEYTPPDVFTGASAEAAGTSGLVPPPAAGDEKKCRTDAREISRANREPANRNP